MHDSDPDESFFVALGIVGMLCLNVLITFLVITFNSWLSSAVGYETSLDHTPMVYFVSMVIFIYISFITTRK